MMCRTQCSTDFIFSYERQKNYMTQDSRSGNRGAYFVEGDADGQIIREWLHSQGKSADGYSDADTFIGAVVNARYWWVVIAKGGRALTLPFFDRLFRASIETDTELWTADDNTEFGLHLFCSMMANWEFLAPYVPDSPDTFSLTSVRDALSRIEARIRFTATEVIAAEVRPIEDPSISSHPEEGLIVKNALVINAKQFTVSYREQQCFLGNSILFDLAVSLWRAPGKWHSFSELRVVWKEYDVGDSTIGRTLRLLRYKLNEAGVTGITIENSRNMRKHARLLIS